MNYPADAWLRLMQARLEYIDELHAEGLSDVDIVKRLNVDSVQVRLNRTRNRAMDKLIFRSSQDQPQTGDPSA